MSTRVAVEERLKRVVVTVLPRLPSVTVAETVLSHLARRPELGGWDWIFDIRAPHDKATPEELDQIAAAFNAARSKQSYTIFISEDPVAFERCRIMDVKFLDRRHLVARDMRAAKALIGRTLPTVL